MSLFGGVIPVTGVTFLIFSVFAVAVFGYALGRITIKGVALGTAGVFIVALLFGAFFYDKLDAQLLVKVTTEAGEKISQSYTTNALKIVENMGLIFFVTSVGFIAGPKFFGNFKKNFKSYVVIGLIIILSGGLVAVGCIFIGRSLNLCDGNNEELTAIVAGIFSGALTSTPAFSAAKATVSPEYEPAVAVGLGIAYIFGVVGVVLFVQLIPKIVHANIDEERAKAIAVQAQFKQKFDPSKLIKLDDFSFLPFSAAAVIGTLFGMIKIPLTGKGLSGICFSLTTTGGCLLVALVIGHFGHIGKVTIMPTEHTLKVFRELGLMLFLIGAGIPGGAKFVEYFNIAYFFFGVAITLVPMVIGYIFAKYVLKLSLFNNLGSITGGMTSTPALGTLIHVTKSEDVASAYAATYPVALIAVVLVSQFIILLF